MAQAFLQPVDIAPGENVPWIGGSPHQQAHGGERSSRRNQGAIAFQYWPESLSDTKGGGWNSKSVSGGSHPLYRWGSGGERALSFTAVFTTDTAPDTRLSEGVNLANTHAYSNQVDMPLNGMEIGTYDLDPRVMVSWLRWFMYPTYGADGAQPAYDPAKALLVMPNSGIGHSGVDYVLTVMTQCDVTYAQWFESGVPRIVEVALSFAEVVQEAARVRFHDRRDMFLSGHAFVFREVDGLSRH